MATATDQNPDEPAPGLAPVKLVIIDDHQLVRDGLRALLAAVPTALQIVGEAGTAREGYARIRESQPDLVVLDLNLPDQNGVHLAAEIRSTWPRIKILVLTGSSSQPAAVEVARAGADGFVRKEDAANEFLRAIPVVLAGKPYFSPVAATAIAQALWQNPQARPTAPALAEREQEVLRGLADGLGYKEIASQLQISVRTAETYRARLVRKLGCSTRAELVRYAVRHGLVKA
jgi:DNA-binding NarL/FixJ family response regulator